MITVLIIEDESPAAKRIERMLSEIDKNASVIGKCDSISSAVSFLQNNPHPDLILLDIQLGDGISFDIFEKIKVQSFVIFTTAYNEYAIQAFELNSVDYLLKPVRQELLQKSYEKFMSLKSAQTVVEWSNVVKAFDGKNRKFKQRFLVSSGSQLIFIDTNDIAYFSTLEKSTFLTTITNRSFAIDYSLDKLEEIIDPEQFFRINRQFFCSLAAISKINIVSSSRLKLELNPPQKEHIFVSEARITPFKKWLDR